jgi:hypothetical protein
VATVAGLALASFSSGTPLAPSEAQAADCSVHAQNPTLHDDARLIQAQGNGRDCGGLSRVCVTLSWGHAVPPYGWTWEKHAESCRDTYGIPEWVLHTATPKCYPGIYYTEVRGYNSAGAVVAHDLSAQLDAGCNKENW